MSCYFIDHIDTEPIMSVIKQMIPRELVEFQDELKYHPKLIEQIRLQARTFEEGLAMAATYVGVVVDGYYDVAPLCAMLVRKLQACRHVIVVESITRDSLAQDAPVVSADPEAEAIPSGESLLILPPKLQ